MKAWSVMQYRQHHNNGHSTYFINNQNTWCNQLHGGPNYDDHCHGKSLRELAAPVNKSNATEAFCCLERRSAVQPINCRHSFSRLKSAKLAKTGLRIGGKVTNTMIQ